MDKQTKKQERCESNKHYLYGITHEYAGNGEQLACESCQGEGDEDHHH